LQMKSNNNSAGDSGDSTTIENHIDSIKGVGQPLSLSLRNFFEPRFGYDFSGVKIHSVSYAAESASMINAEAYTIGRNIVFGAGQFKPETNEGRRLLAHELTHLVQQQSLSTSIQREEGAASTFSIATATWQQAIQEARRLLQTRSAANRATALSYYKQLIIRAAQNVPVPAPLTAQTPTEADIRWSWSTNVDWSATTDPNRVDNYPSNYWQWLQFNPSVFDHSQTYAESIITHELDHAAHAKALYNAWTAAGARGSWDTYYQQHYQRWTERAIRVSSPGLVGALSGLPSRIQPSVIEFRAYVRQLTNYFHRLSRTDHDLLPKGVVLFYPLRIQNVPTETVRDTALDLAAARQELLQYFARPPVQDSTQRTYLQLLLAQGFKSALRLFRPAADQPQMTKDFSTIMQFSTSEDMLRTARQNYRPQP
jgi:Domain of unknown function (DUF4157)